MSAALPLKARVLAAVAAAPSLSRRQGGRRALGLAAASIAAALAALQLAGGLAHAGTRPAVLTVRLADGWALASAALTWLLFRRAAPMGPFSRVLAVATLAAPVALSVWMARFHGTYPEPPAAGPWDCVALTLAVAATPLAAFLVHQRGLEPHRPDLLGAAAGAASGAWAGVVALVWCPLTAPGHALVGHVVPLALMTAVGSLLGARLLAVR